MTKSCSVDSQVRDGSICADAATGSPLLPTVSRCCAGAIYRKETFGPVMCRCRRSFSEGRRRFYCILCRLLLGMPHITFASLLCRRIEGRSSIRRGLSRFRSLQSAPGRRGAGCRSPAGGHAQASWIPRAGHGRRHRDDVNRAHGRPHMRGSASGIRSAP